MVKEKKILNAEEKQKPSHSGKWKFENVKNRENQTAASVRPGSSARTTAGMFAEEEKFT